MKRIFSLLFASALCIVTRVSATEAIYSFAGAGNIAGYAMGGAGFAFEPLTSISVTSLGFGGSDLAFLGYQVTLWNSGGTQLASTTVTTGSSFLNQTYYGDVTPVTLTAGQTYYLGAMGVSTGRWVGNAFILPPDSESNGTISVAPDIAYLGGAAGMSSNGGIPLSITDIAFYLNANFQYTTVPEPCLLGLGGVCAAGLIGMRRRG